MAGKLEYSADFKRNYMAFFAIFIFVLMISAELVIALSIPRFVNRENAFADQIRKREMLLRFDETRRNCSAIRENNSVLGMEKRLLSDTLDQLAIYLRRESDRLTPEDVNALYPLVTDLFKISARLKKSEPFSQENKLDSSFYLNNLLKKYAIE